MRPTLAYLVANKHTLHEAAGRHMGVGVLVSERALYTRTQLQDETSSTYSRTSNRLQAAMDLHLLACHMDQIATHWRHTTRYCKGITCRNHRAGKLRRLTMRKPTTGQFEQLVNETISSNSLARHAERRRGRPPTAAMATPQRTIQHEVMNECTEQAASSSYIKQWLKSHLPHSMCAVWAPRRDRQLVTSRVLAGAFESLDNAAPCVLWHIAHSPSSPPIRSRCCVRLRYLYVSTLR